MSAEEPAGHLYTQEQIDRLMAAINSATPAEVRAWAHKTGRTVGARGHLPQGVINAFNRYHRRKYENQNPWKGHA